VRVIVRARALTCLGLQSTFRRF